MNLKNKICIITGSTGGLGEEIIDKLANNQVKIIALGKNQKKLIKLKKKYKNNIIETFCCDLSNQKRILSTIKNIKHKKYNIDILINCAGNFLVKDFKKISIKEINKNINVNIIAPFLFSKEFISNMKKQKWGRIVNIGSSSSYFGFAKSVLYCSAKHALLGFSRSVNEEFKKHGVRSYIFSPGSIKTKMGKLVKNQNYQTFIDPNELSSFIISTIKQNNNMVTEEIKINRINYN